MKKLFLIALIAVAAAGFAFAGGGSEGDDAGGFSGSYAFGGSTTVLPIAEVAIEEFMDMHPGVELTYEGQGSSVGVQGVIDGVYALGGASRELKDKEMSAGAVATPIALDGIAVVVNGGVPVDNLSLGQVARIFTGEIRNWSAVGGPYKPIVVVNRDEASGTRAAFLELCLEEALGDDVKFILDAITVESNGDMVTKVGATPDAIGYCGFGYIDRARNAGAKEISVDGSDPTVDNVLSGSYPISRKLNIVHKGALAEGSLEKAFVDFLLSPDGQAIVEDEGFIALP
ncbi:MAG: phosphate ABC transporter substrate-binding protein [Spirochaetales bacterium]|nr:phosphate ABC transporter substrate-binding protein [Spirochaetales bacterium]